MTAIILTIDLPFLAREVNDAHGQVTFHAKSLLAEAKRAGEALLHAKKLCRHGEFKAWVEANCRCNYRTAAKYMRVARKCAEVGTFDPATGVDAFHEAHAQHREPTAPPPVFRFEDAELALKFDALATRGVYGEASVAANKLNQFAARFGMTGEEAAAKARLMTNEFAADWVPPDFEVRGFKFDFEQEDRRLSQTVAELRQRLDTVDREGLIHIIAEMTLTQRPFAM